MWAVGIGRNAGETQVHSLVEHWNGSQWQSQPAPQASEALNSISAISAQNFWAAGNDTHGNLLIEHWDGQQWRSVALPGSLARAESGVSITAAFANNIWALGNVKGSDQVNHMLILHWNGKSWQQVFPPALQLPANTANTFADGITVSGGQIWIVGNARDSEGGYSSALILGQRTCL